MPNGLMDMLKGAVSKQVMGQMGGLIGQSPEKTSSVFETAAGSILGGLIKKSAGGGSGSADIFKAVQNTDSGILDKLGDLMGGGDKTEQFQKQGGGVLDMVFGDSQGGIFSAIAKALGLKEGIIGTIMKMAAPILMGVIAKHVKNKALDAAGLGSFLGEQKSSLSNFMPSGLADNLGFGNLLGGATGAVGDAARSVTGAARDVGSAASGAARNVGSAASGAARDTANAGGSMLKWLIPLLLVAALAFLAWKMFAPAVEDAGDAIGNAGSAVVDGASDLVDGAGGAIGGLSLPEMPGFDGIDMGDFDAKGLNEKFTGIAGGFKDLTADNAQGLADNITGLTGGLGDMGFDSLPELAKAPVGTMIDGFRTTVDGQMEKVEDQGILGILKPVLAKLWEAFKGLGFGS